MIEIISEVPNEISKKFILRALIGTVNGSLVGVLSSHVRRTKPVEGSGVDGYNDQKAAETVTDDAPVGMEPGDDPIEVATNLKCLKDYLLTIGTASLPVEELPNDLGETIDFMAGREPREGGEAIKQLAEALKLSPAELEKARQEMFRRDAEWLKEHRQVIIDLEASLPVHDAENAYSRLPARVRAKLVDRGIKAVERQTQMAIQAVLRGRLAAVSEVTLNRDIVERINQHAKLEAKRDPAFEEALAQVA